MQRIINDPTQVVEDMLKGFVKCHTDLVAATDNPRVLKYVNAPVPGKVGIVTGGGSGVGISALINGTTDICNASRPMKASERDKLKQRYSSLGVEIRVAKDGISLPPASRRTLERAVSSNAPSSVGTLWRRKSSRVAVGMRMPSIVWRLAPPRSASTKTTFRFNHAHYLLHHSPPTGQDDLIVARSQGGGQEGV